jgi:hypothetical protein
MPEATIWPLDQHTRVTDELNAPERASLTTRSITTEAVPNGIDVAAILTAGL